MELRPHIAVDDALQILDPEGANMDRHATDTTGRIRGANGSGSVQWSAMRHGIAGIYGNRGIVESVTYRI